MTKWQEVKLAELATIKYGKNQKDVAIEISNIPIYGTGGIMGYASKALYDKPSVLIGRKGTIDKVRYVTKPFWAVDTTFYTIINENKILPRYFYYLLSLVDLSSYNEGTTIPSLRTETLNRLEFMVPPLDVQKKIAGVLCALDDKIELNNKINANLEQQAQALFKSWFVDFEPFGGTMPKDWKESDIYSISNIIYGAPFASKLFNTEKKGLPIIRIRDLKNQHFDTYTEEIHPKAYIIKAGDIVVGMDGEFRPYIWGNDEGLLNQRVCVFENKRSLGKMFLYLTIKPLLNRVEQTEVATTVIHIGKQDFDAFRFSMPSNSILDKFDAVTQPIYNKIVSNSLENTRLASLRDALLPKLMSGEIDVSKVDINKFNAADMLL